jgi:hypothetical protein
MARNPITYTEIKSFCELYGIRMSGRDVDVIMQLDEISIQQPSEKEK